MSKVSGPNSVTSLELTPRFEGCVVRCGSKNGHQKDLFKRDWTACSSFVNHSRLNSQHNWRNLYDHLMRKRNFT